MAEGFAIRRLSLSQFRNYAALRLETEGRGVVLTGPNGAGKTNLLEALSFLSPGRGLRRARLADVRRRGGHGDWAVATTAETPDGRIDLGTGTLSTDSNDAAERRVVRLNGSTARSQTELARVFSVSWLTPEMDRLFVDAAAARRRFLDRLVYGFAAEHVRRVNAYERAMRDRSRLLRDGISDRGWLDALENAMAENAVAIAAARLDVIGRLQRAAGLGIGPFPTPGLTVAGDVEGWLADMPALDAEDRLRAALAASRPTDAATGGAAVGTHRTDLLVEHMAQAMPAALCSTGEQKALLIALVLASARLQTLERQAPPMLLLDEVAAHLDPDRRAALFDEISALRAQAWMTGTEPGLFEAMRGRAQFLEAADGAVTPIAG